MMYTSFPEGFTKVAKRALNSSRLLALLLIAAFSSVAMQPAHAQSSDTWKSIAIIGGSTAAGAYIGHKIAHGTGAVIGAGVGASAGYAIDRRRRANQYYNNEYGYGNNGYNRNNDAYYGNGAYYGDGNYNGGSYSYPSGYQDNTYYGNSGYGNGRCPRRR